MSVIRRWTEAILARLLEHPLRDEILGDLGEELAREGHGFVAHLRYLGRALAIVARVQWVRLTEGTGRDVRVAFRQLRRDPGFSMVAIGALALGVGVSATIFAVADDVLFEPLPYPHANRLAIVTNEHIGSTTGGFGVSYRNMEAVQSGAGTLETFSLYMDWRDLTLAGPEGALRIPSAFVDAAYFDLMGLALERGRWIRAEENGVNAAGAVAVLSRGAWQRIYGGDPGIIGRIVRLNGLPYEIVGVLADDRGDLRYRWGEQPADLFLPLFAAERLTTFDLDGDRGLRVLNALVRVREGISIDGARADLRRISDDLAAEFPRSNEGWSYEVQRLDDAFFDDLQGPLRILVAGSILVFVLVAVNLAGLVLMRTTERRAELAMRRALGARAGRVARQLVTESLVICSLGGLAGLLIASWGTGFVASSGLLQLPSFAAIRLEPWIATAAVGGALAAGLGLGATATLAAGAACATASGKRTTEGRAGLRLRSALVVAEVALAFALLVGAGLVLSSFWNLSGTGYGFDTDNLLLARVDLRGEAYPRERLAGVAARLAADGAAIPGALDAFIWSPNRLGHGNQVEILTPEGRFADHVDERLEASLHTLHPGTLTKLGIPLLAGRDVSTADRADTRRVALVSERLASDLWPGEDAVGKRLETVEGGELVRIEVIGVTADARHRTRLIDPFGPQRDVYYPFAQSPWRTLTLALRFAPGVDTATLAGAVRNMVRDLGDDIPVYDVGTMGENLRQEESSARLSAALVMLYAALTVALAALGLYGMLAHSVRSRRQEIGVRLALGADSSAVLAGTMRSGIKPVAIGGLMGLVASLAMGRLLAGALYGVSAYDPLTYALVPLLLAAVATTALYLPARRASRTDPVEVLRPE